MKNRNNGSQNGDDANKTFPNVQASSSKKLPINNLIKPLLSASIILIFSRMALQLTNFIYNVLMAKQFTHKEFGDFIVIMAFINILGVPASVVSNLISRLTSEFYAKGILSSSWRYISKIFNWMAAGFIFISVLVFFADSRLMNIFNMDIESGFFIGILCIGTFYLLNVVIGFLQGAEKFIKLSLIFIFMAMLRLLGAGFTNWFDLSVPVALWIVCSTTAIPLLYYFFGIRRTRPSYSSIPEINITMSKNYIVWCGVIFLFFSIFNRYELLFVKIQFDSFLSGDYSKISLIGSACFMAGSCVTMVIFPKTSRLYDQGEDPAKYFIKGVLLLLFLGIFSILTIRLIPSFILNIFFKSFGIVNRQILFPVVLSGILQSIIYMIVSYEVAIRRNAIIIPVLFILVIEIILFYFYGSTIDRVVWMGVGIGGMGVLTSAYYHFRSEKMKFQNTVAGQGASLPDAGEK